MASFDSVNYSLRPSKSIQRQLVFDGVRTLQGRIDLGRMIYVGLGSIWFTDFVLAHKHLGIEKMFSIEADEIGYARASFNAPFATIDVHSGLSDDILPEMLADAALKDRPWFIWMDYDGPCSEGVIGDARNIIDGAPENSIFVLTFNAHEMSYGHAGDRHERMRDLFGDSVPDDLAKRSLKGDRFQETIARLTADFLLSYTAEIAREGGFLPSFRLIYKDTSPMVSVGGILTSAENRSAFEALVGDPQWRCLPEEPIIAPNLTLKEAVMIQALLPRIGNLSRDDIRALGFDLEDAQIRAFQNYYQQYPSFAQILS